MVTFEEALEVAKKTIPNLRINHCYESASAYIFSDKDALPCFGGDEGPIHIRKSDGRAISSLGYYEDDSLDKAEIKEWDF